MLKILFMAGVPYHSAQHRCSSGAWLQAFVIAEQMEDPKQAVGVVKREVVQVITPGTVVDSSKPDSQTTFVAIDRDGSQYGSLRPSTGDFYVTGIIRFFSSLVESGNLKAREVVIGYDLPGADLSRQMNLAPFPTNRELMKTHIY